MDKRTRVAVKLTVEVDLAAWAKQQGVDDGAGNFKTADARDDLRHFILNMVQQSTSLEDANAEVTLA